MIKKVSKHASIKTKLLILIAIFLIIIMTSVTIVSINLFKDEVQSMLQEETVEKVEFLNTSGWYVTEKEGAGRGINVNVSDVKITANYLTADYENYFWYCQ